MKGGRKNLKRASKEEIQTLLKGQSIMQVVSLRGSNLIEVMDAAGQKSLALFPAKFQKSMWIRRVDFDHEYLLAKLQVPAVAPPPGKAGASGSDSHRSRKRKERAESSTMPSETLGDEHLEIPLPREEPAPYCPDWAINIKDSALADVRIARELVGGSRLPVDRSVMSEKTSGTIMGASQQVIASALLHVREMCDRLQLTMDLNSALENEKNALSDRLSDMEREMHTAMDKLGSCQGELSKYQAAVSVLKKEVKKAGKRAVEDFKSSGEYRDMVGASSALAYSKGIHRLLDHLKTLHPDLDVGEFVVPPRVTQAGPVPAEREKVDQEKGPQEDIRASALDPVERVADSRE